jgi:hypothetical protein
VRPLSELKGPEWFLVVHRDLNGANAVAMRAIVLALAYAVSAVLVIGALALVAIRKVSRSVYSGEPDAWIWPYQGRPKSYRVLTLFCFVVLAVALSAMALLDGPHLCGLRSCHPFWE